MFTSESSVITFTEMPSVNCNEKVNYGNCGTQFILLKNAPHKKRCPAGSPACPSCTTFATKTRAEINYHIAEKHSKATAWVVRRCILCVEDFQGF